MFKFLVICGCLLAIANVGAFGGLIAAPAPAVIAIKPATIALPTTIAAAPILKAPLIAAAPAAAWAQPTIGLAAPLGLGLKLG
ncbi:hypothetical protein ACFW04_008628 [Cataglyphis niger]